MANTKDKVLNQVVARLIYAICAISLVDTVEVNLSYPNDDEVVKHMLLNNNGVAELPVVIEDFKMTDIPKDLLLKTE